jgi:hypothetical protein
MKKIGEIFFGTEDESREASLGLQKYSSRATEKTRAGCRGRKAGGRGKSHKFA